MRDSICLNPVHPGEVLEADFMTPFGLSVGALARAIGISPTRLNDIIRGHRGITAETALRLARYFGTDADSWMNLQNRYELAVAEQEAGPEIRQIRPMRAALGEGPDTIIGPAPRVVSTGRQPRRTESGRRLRPVESL